MNYFKLSKDESVLLYTALSRLQNLHESYFNNNQLVKLKNRLMKYNKPTPLKKW